MAPIFFPSIETKIKAIVDGFADGQFNNLNIPKIKNKSELKLRNIPNVHVARKYENYLKDKHEEKIANVKAIVDTSSPKYMRQPSKSKKIQMDLYKNKEIEKLNLKLYKKIESIKPSVLKQNPPSPVMKNRLSAQRHKQQVKIELENVKIQERISKARNGPVSNDWKQGREKNLEYLKNIARYPKKFYVEAEILGMSS
eukprot:NODE_537_length_7002_cov_0.281762.p5 type:complete len:198 gc:universal NODE_537_length_7002_cov_0.281762:2793-2200(-)